MTGLEIGGLGFVALLILLALRIPIGVSMLVVGMAAVMVFGFMNVGPSVGSGD